MSINLVIKRGKKAQKFDKSKILSSIKKAFKSCEQTVTSDELDKIYSLLELKNGMRTEDIQTQIEYDLMKLGYYKVAKFFIIHRHINYYENYLGNKNKFMREYLGASNAATGSKYDANSNVTELNLATLNGELFKGDIIKLNRFRLTNKITDMYGPELAKEYIHMLETHRLYKHDESSIYPYCTAISMYPYLLNGLKDLGGLSAKPCNLDSYCGTFVNLVFAVSAMFAGAVATGEYLMYFNYFAEKDLGGDYYKNPDEFRFIGWKFAEILRETNIPFKKINTIEKLSKVEFESEYLNKLRDEILYDSTRKLTKEELAEWYEKNHDTYSGYEPKMGDGTRTIKSYLSQKFQQVVYSLNQPAAARNFQSTFWNISYFDRYYFNGLFDNFRFPDGESPNWDSLNWLQKYHMKWFNKERLNAVLTFPVETVAMLTEGDDIKDKEWGDFTAEMYSEGHSFFTYLSDNPDSLSSCCRLRNEVTDNSFSYSLGAGGIATGSKSVMTLNINRLVQDAIKQKKNYIEYLRVNVLKVHKFQIAFNELMKEFYDMGALPVYKAGFIDLKKQYLTIGVNGVVEAAEFLGIPIKPCEEYNNFIDSILRVFYEENKKAKTSEIQFNTEFVPAENLGVKHRKWDEEDGYVVPKNRNCYNSYFYASEDTSLTLIDKFKMHGKDYVKFLDGGSALHMNMDRHLSKEEYRKVLKIAVMYGTNYFTFNIPNTICNECGTIDKRKLDACPKCGSKNIDYLTRVIGYLKRVSNFSEARQTEAHRRYYLNGKNEKLLTEVKDEINEC